MNSPEMNIKLSYVPGLRDIVLKELFRINTSIVCESEDSIYIPFSLVVLREMKQLRSIARIYLVMRGLNLNPTYISNHKSILGNLIEVIIKDDKFKTFKISCAGSDSPEVQSIVSYIKDTFKIIVADDADLKIHMIKPQDMWEVGLQVTARPLSVREYKVVNMKGAIDPTIAYAINSLCVQNTTHTYLNIFSGSGTLLIEAARSYPQIDKLIGLDNNKGHLSLSIQNIKKANLIQRIQVKEADIFDTPDLGEFDTIVSDLPFGMVISKDQDLQKLYKTFIEYCQKSLVSNGRLGIYTSEYQLFESLISQSQFKVVQSLQLKLSTSVGAYLRPKIIICEFKDKV